MIEMLSPCRPVHLGIWRARRRRQPRTDHGTARREDEGEWGINICHSGETGSRL